MKNYPKIYNNDIKVLGRVVSLATENKVAAAEQIFDEKFKYSELDSYSWDNVDLTQAGLDQYTINRLFGKKLKKLDDNIKFDDDGWVLNLKVRNLTAGTITADTINTKDLNVSNGAQINNLHITGRLTVGNLNIADLQSRVEALEGWRTSATSDLTNHANRISTLEACCNEVRAIINNLPTGAGDASFTVSPKLVELTVGENALLTVTKGADLTGTVRYSSNNTSIATVSASGKITAVGAGETTITVSVDGFRPTEDVTVKVTAPTPIYRITFNPNNGNPNFHQDVLEGNKLVAVTDPIKEGYTFNGWHVNSDTGTVWNFNDPVTSTMMLIAGYTQNEAPTPEYSVSVSPKSFTYDLNGGSVTAIEFDITLNGWNNNNWSYSITDENGVQYNSSNGSGTSSTKTKNTWFSRTMIERYMHLGENTSTVHVTVDGDTTGNEYTDTFVVNVIDTTVPETHVYTLSVDPTEKTITSGGDGFTITATPKDNDNPITGQTVIWTSSNSAAATVNGGVVTPASGLTAAASTTITATWASPDGNKTATCLVTVNPVPTQDPASITITGAKDLKVGTTATASDKTCTLVATISPAEADQSVTWSSSDNTKANVNNGVVSAISEGSVTITATSIANPLVSGSVTINITLENTPEPTHDEKYKVSWTTGNAHLLHATTDNGARTADWGSAWTADISVDAGYYITGVHVYKQENDVRGEEMTTNASGTNIVHGVGSISIEQMYNDVEIVITTAYNQETGTWNVDWQGVIDNHGAVDTVAGPHTPHGTVEKNGMINYLVEVNEGYAFAENNPITVTMGGVDVSNDTSKVWYGEHHFDSQDGQATDIAGYNVYLSPVTGDVVITISTVAVEPPTVNHTVSWTFIGDGEHAQLNDVNPSNVSNNSVEVTHGASFTARIDADEDYNAYMYNLQMKDENGDWQNLYTYGTEGGGNNYYDPVTFLINVLRVTGDVRFEIYTERALKRIIYKTNIENACKIEEGAVSPSDLNDRRVIGDNLQYVTENGVEYYYMPAPTYTDSVGATFHVQDGYAIQDITVSWDGDAPTWVNSDMHNQFDNPVLISWSLHGINGIFEARDGIKSDGVVTITLVESDWKLQHSITWSGGTMSNMSTPIENGGFIDDGSDWTATFTPDDTEYAYGVSDHFSTGDGILENHINHISIQKHQFENVYDITITDIFADVEFTVDLPNHSAHYGYDTDVSSGNKVISINGKNVDEFRTSVGDRYVYAFGNTCEHNGSMTDVLEIAPGYQFTGIQPWYSGESYDKVTESHTISQDGKTLTINWSNARSIPTTQIMFEVTN